LPVREAGLLVPAADLGLCSFAIRGANGIDGVVSTAAGAALGDGLPTLVLVGDISFLHDIGALWAAGAVTSPLAILVVDNRGGRIFEQLPVYESVGDDLLKYWTTPHGADLSGVTALYAMPSLSPTDLGSLEASIRQALTRPGPTVIHALVPPSSPRTDSAELGAAIAQALLDL
jgi:2-succinyl-5-enolpyruvyl-6-hydroxy-3-cyclohexene-1-carboxylate synthase